MKQAIVFLLLCSFIILVPSTSTGIENLLPCESAVLMTPFDLALMRRVQDHFLTDRDADVMVVRVLFLPDYSFGYADGPSEWALSIYVSSDDSSELELAAAQGSIRGANTKWCKRDANSSFSSLTEKEVKVPIALEKRTIDKELTYQIIRFIEDFVLRSTYDIDDEIEICGDTSLYHFMVKSGVTICGQMPSCGIGGGLDLLEQFAEALHGAAQTDGADFEKALRNIGMMISGANPDQPAASERSTPRGACGRRAGRRSQPTTRQERAQ